MSAGRAAAIACHKPVPRPFSLTIKKSVLWLLILIAVASVERYVWVNYHGPTEDLMWYLDEERAPQPTFLGFDKRKVSFLIDQFSSYGSKLWAASVLSGLMFSLAVFASNRNQGFNRVTSGLILVACLLLMNKYFFQLDMHLWRQQIAFYGFIVAVNQSRFLKKAAFTLIALFFHEATLLLFVLYYVAGLLIRLCRPNLIWNLLLVAANTILFFVAIKIGYLQVSIIGFFCVVMLLTHQFNRDVRRTCIFIVLLNSFVLFAQVQASNLGIGVASAERLVFLAVMTGLFLFYNTTTSDRPNASPVILRNTPTQPSTGVPLINSRLIKTGVLISLKIGFVTYYAYVSSI